MTLCRCLQERLGAVCVSSSSALGIDPDAKEAMCFALLGYQTMHGVSTSLPSVTGARHKAVLGKICHAPQSITINDM